MFILYSFQETQGVPVSVLGESNLFPAFYARSHAGLKAPQHLKTIAQAAKLIAMSKKAQLRNGHLIAVPVPEEFSMDGNFHNYCYSLCFLFAIIKNKFN